MNVSNVLSFMGLSYRLNGDEPYSPTQSLSDLDLQFFGTTPTDAQYHAAATDLQKLDLQNLYSGAMQEHLDVTAQSKGYANGYACASYVTSSNVTWKAEADAFVSWRDSCWVYAFDIESQVESGTIPPPSVEEFINGAPIIIW